MAPELKRKKSTEMRKQEYIQGQPTEKPWILELSLKIIFIL